MHWRRNWQPTPVFLPGESQGRGSLVGCRLWGRTESDSTEAAAAAAARALEKIMGNYLIDTEEEMPYFGHRSQEMYKKRLMCSCMKNV